MTAWDSDQEDSVESSGPSFDTRKRAWWAWHQANPEVWRLFDRFAFEAIEHGHKVSHWLIINRIRWETFIVTTGHDYKLSNDHIAFYARLWRAVYPEHKDLFTIKRMKGEFTYDEPSETS
jgi:hypothetical protein